MEEQPTTPTTTDIWLDMETGDPDDCLTLLLLLVHSKVTLRGVSIFPGDAEQVGFVKGLLRKFVPERVLPVGHFKADQTKKHLGPNNVKLFGQNLAWKPETSDGEAHNLMAQYLLDYPGGTIITGGPLGNVFKLLTEHEIQMEKIFVQGGFAGARCVSEENQLQKFKGLEYCPTFNFSGHVPGANALLNTSFIEKKHLISKDVCHSVSWDPIFHKMAMHFKNKLPSSPKKSIWDLMIGAMGAYQAKRNEGKMLHDPLAACTCINPAIIQFCEVKVSRNTKGQWGSVPTPGTNTWISVAVDKPKFYATFLDIEEQDILAYLKVVNK